MEHERNAHGAIASTRELGTKRTRRRGKRVAAYVGEIDRGALENLTIFEDAAHSAPALRAGPCVFNEACGVDFLQLGNELLLQALQVFIDPVRVHA
jgi:hypothetical protein